MAVSNPATLSSVKAEFGGNGILSQYVRGGAYVPSNASATIATTAGSLALSQFNGVSKPPAGVGASISPASSSTSSTLRGSPVIQTSGSFTATGTGGTGSYTYAWSAVNAGGASNVAVTSPTAQATTIQAAVATSSLVDDGGTVSGSATVNVTCVVTSGGVTATATAKYYLSQSYASCVAFDSWMVDGRRASDYQPDDALMVTDPFSALFNTRASRVIDAWTATVPGVRIHTALGAILECSTTAPIPVQAGGYVAAPELLGHHVPTARPEDIREPNTFFLWDEVVLIEPIEALLVRGLFVLDRCFWASMDGKRFILHHNAKLIAPP